MGTLSQASSVVEYSVLFYYTSLAGVKMGGTDAIKLTLEKAIEDVNSGYKNSNIELRATFFCALEIKNNIVHRFKDVNRKNFQSLESYGADVLAYVGTEEEVPGLWAGQASIFTPVETHVAFLFMKAEYLNTRHILAHEIGHTLGAGHDTKMKKKYKHGATNFAWEWEQNGRNHGTIMSYAPKKENYYSSPMLQTSSGHVTGTNDADNLSTIKKNMRIFAAKGDESGKALCRSRSLLNFGGEAVTTTLPPRAPTTTPSVPTTTLPPTIPTTTPLPIARECLAISPANMCCVRHLNNSMRCNKRNIDVSTTTPQPAATTPQPTTTSPILAPEPIASTLPPKETCLEISPGNKCCVRHSNTSVRCSPRSHGSSNGVFTTSSARVGANVLLVILSGLLLAF